MATDEEYQAMISRLGWDGLHDLWKNIKERDTPYWEPGKALEYLVVRTFQLNGSDVRWPYRVKMDGQEIEQIDGVVYVDSIACLIECKDLNSNVNVEPIAKLRNQLLRRPGTTIGTIFSRHGFTQPASTLARFVAPQTILLWNGEEIEQALEDRNFRGYLTTKYRAYVEYGQPDFDIREETVTQETEQQKQVYLIVEGPFDKYLLEQVLEEDVLELTEIVVGTGKDPATSIARSLLRVGDRPVALLVDADTVDPKSVQDLEGYLQHSLSQASVHQHYEVFLAEPEIEIILLEDKELVEELVGHDLSWEDLQLAKSAPKSLFRLQQCPNTLPHRLQPFLTEERVETIRQHPLIQQLSSFLRDHN